MNCLPGRAGRRRPGGAAVATLLATLLAACLPARSAPADGAAPPAARATVQVLSAVAPAPPPGAPTMAVYLQLRNRGALPDALLAVSTPLAGEAMVHEQKMDGGMMRMRMLERLAVPAGATVAMHAGGLHVMLGTLARAPKAGERFPIRLRFERAGEVTAQVTVLPLGSAP